MNAEEFKERYSQTRNYRGIGYLRGNKLDSPISGNTSVQINPLGEIVIEMDLKLDLLTSLRQINSKENNLTIFTQAGKFVASEVTIAGDFPTIDSSEKIRLIPRMLIFEVSDISDDDIYYWLLPLINLITNFGQSEKYISEHPLAIRNDPRFPAIIFEYENDLAYIQPAPDYNQRLTALKDKSSLSIITGLMVGITGNQPIETILDWIPTDLLYLLGVLSGVEVGLSWIELYNISGQLIRCIYINTFLPSFKLGHASVINPLSISEILNNYLHSSHYGKTNFRVAMRYISRTGLGSRLLNENLYYICLALELLCKYHEVDTVDLLSLLNTDLQIKAKKLLKDTVNFVSELETVSNADEKAALERIKNRIYNAASKDRSFALSVIELMKIYLLADLEIVEAYYKFNLSRHATWSGAVSYHRGVIAHTGYFETSSGNDTASETMVVTNHLHDIAIRIILKMIRYNGTYQPSMFPAIAIYEENVNWVHPTMTAFDLGYKK